jgi:transposase
MTRTRVRLSEGIHESVFAWVLGLCASKKLLVDPKSVAVDSTTLEANAALKSIVRKGTGEDYKTYLRGLMRAEGVEDPSDEDLIKFDRKRKGKTLSNDDWESKGDPDSRVMRMKDKTTHLGYKAENVVDLDSDVIVASEVYFGDEGDTQTCVESVMAARVHLDRIELEDAEAKSKLRIEEAAMDKGYHGGETLALAYNYSIRTYVAEPDRPHRSKWTDKPAGQKEAVYANRRRIGGDRGKALQRKRSEYIERTFAHTCETGGARRTWLRKLQNVRKRFPMTAAARNLGTLMRFLYGVGTPKHLQNGLSEGQKAKFEAENGTARLLSRLLGSWKSLFCMAARHGRFKLGTPPPNYAPA